MPFRSSNYEGEEAWTLVYRHEAKVLKSDKTGSQEAAYTEGETERRFPFFEYPVPDFSVTGRYTNLDVGEGEVRDLRPDW